jgi:predicted ester cyclase
MILKAGLQYLSINPYLFKAKYSSTPKNKCMRPNKLFAFCAFILAIAFVACNQEKTSPAAIVDDSAAKAEAKKADISKSFFAAYEQGDYPAMEKMMSSDFTEHSYWTPTSGLVGRDTTLASWKMFKDGFPDLKYEILNTAVNGDMVYINYRFTASNDGNYMGMPATNKKINITGVDLFQVKDSTITGHWDFADNVTFQKQLGVAP